MFTFRHGLEHLILMDDLGCAVHDDMNRFRLHPLARLLQNQLKQCQVKLFVYVIFLSSSRRIAFSLDLSLDGIDDLVN